MKPLTQAFLHYILGHISFFDNNTLIMKICLCLQRRFAYIGHSLAALVQEEHPDTAFCAYVYTRPSFDFLEAQQEVPYTALLLDEDIHEEYKRESLDPEYLAWLEKEYGLPHLWPYLEIDRIVRHDQLVREYPHDALRYTHEEMLRILQVKAKRVIEFLDREKPEVIFFSAIGAVSLLLLYHIAKKRGIRTLCLTLNFLPGMIALSDHYAYFNKDRTAVTSERQAMAQALITKFREKPHKYSEIHDPTKQKVNREQQFSFLSPKNLLRSARWFSHLLREHYERRDRFDYSYIHPAYYLLDRFKRKLRNLRPVAYDRFDASENFAFFPLQLEPEISLLLLAPFATDQIHVIKQIARSLPVGYKLYVKEHPQMVPYRPRSFYRELKKIPNVKLIHPGINSFELIAAARLITTITGTAGWEAVLLRKPVITFGDIFYNPLSSVKQCASYHDLASLVKTQLENFNYNEAELVDFVAQALAYSSPVDLLYLWEKETDEAKKKNSLRPLAAAMAQVLGI